MFLAIDPSVNHLGVCLYNPDTKEFEWVLIEPQGATLELKLYTTGKLIEHWLMTKHNLDFSRISKLICEYPQYFNSQKGAVASKMGYTNDLAAVCGYLAGVCKFAKSHFFTPIKWKGNLTKHAIEKRFCRKFEGIHYKSLPSEHEQEATLLMLYYIQFGQHQ